MMDVMLSISLLLLVVSLFLVFVRCFAMAIDMFRLRSLLEPY